MSKVTDENTAKIEIDVDLGESLGIKMTCDDKITACDFIRITESLSETISKQLKSFVLKNNTIKTKESIEKILMSDFNENN